MSTVPLALNSQLPVWPDASGALYAGTVLITTPLVAAIGSVLTLTELSHWAAVLFGVAMLVYGTAGIARSGRAIQLVKLRRGGFNAR